VLCLIWLSVNFVDVIEEDALNMESCIQVLRILITKADTEIEELERDLLLLQKELVCVEHEKWPDIFCGVLNERINQLDVAISTLKNDCADEAEVKLLLDSGPTGTLHEILAQVWNLESCLTFNFLILMIEKEDVTFTRFTCKLCIRQPY